MANLKILAALQGKTMMSVLDELVANALKDEQQKKANWLNTGVRKDV